jgi:Ala-tRNA(Pro) deacylase
MAIAQTVKTFLDSHQVHYDVVQHSPALSSMKTAAAAHVPGNRLAKSVILKDDVGYVMAIVPSTHRIELGRLHREMHRPLGLATESETCAIFSDCDTGAIPALGPAYGMMTVVDEALVNQPDIFFEAGDHEELIHLSGSEYGMLMSDARHGRISQHV